MNTETIGFNAGLVWAALNEAETVDTKQLKKMAKLKNDRELYAALGWLAREGKLVFQPGEDGKELLVSLVQDK
ncbi:MAG: winged helix-turn-helix domain-containing protein [Duncaniella sp.]|nr:winged helix-turn-helix domain-containing protein [Bacteroides sp.]MBD5321728.1 winged helix-turn-helix domain-containing protein [Bacteroides sp.]MDE6036653.1 winged helix-turn-helix domain-containing protein [Duncaniella sp.]MDE6066108.1 winged helix-turn-helix domain-containing protein [Duncaniella sp.]